MSISSLSNDYRMAANIQAQRRGLITDKEVTMRFISLVISTLCVALMVSPVFAKEKSMRKPWTLKR